MGNFTLKSAIQSHDCITHNLMFNNFQIDFPTKKDARKALWDGYNYLKRTLDEPMVGCMSGLRYSRQHSLSWDASRAIIKYN
jgi:hypothetical protein